MNENLLRFFRQRLDALPFRRPLDLERLLIEAFDEPSATLPIPGKIFIGNEDEPSSYGFPVVRTPVIEELGKKFERWLDQEIATRSGSEARGRDNDALHSYRDAVLKVGANARHSSILADYHSVFWLIHVTQIARAMTALPKRAMAASSALSREQADVMKYAIAAKWTQHMRDALVDKNPGDTKMQFVRLILDNPLIATEDFVGSDLRELRTYFSGALRRDFGACRQWFDALRSRVSQLLSTNALFRRALAQLGYNDGAPSLVMLLDPRVQQLANDSDDPFYGNLSKRLLEFVIVAQLRRGIVWMERTPSGEHSGVESQSGVVYARATRPMNFGRRDIVEPIVYRYGLVYDITSFTQTLGEIARGGKEEEQASYRQMLDFQRRLGEISTSHALQFEKFLGDGAFYTSRHATRALEAAVEIQSFYAKARAAGFAFNKGMRIALNYGYYRLLPMQVSAESEIKEFYGPGIVELSRLTTGKATKELEDIQQLLLSHGYEQSEVYRFFAPLYRLERSDQREQQREFYAYVNETGHLVNEGIVASLAFLQQLSTELAAEGRKLYRLRTPWSSYTAVVAPDEAESYIAMRMLGSVSLKGIGSMQIAEVARIAPPEAEVSLVDDGRALADHLTQQQHRDAVRRIRDHTGTEAGVSDLVVCQTNDTASTLLLGEWDPVSEEVRRPVRLAGDHAQEYGVQIPLTQSSVEVQSAAFQKLYRALSRGDTLPNISADAIRDNQNFSGFIIGATIERL